MVGVFSTWASDGPVTLNGTQGPNNGWLVLIVAAFALGWTRSMTRGSWVGVAGVLGAAVVMAWTAIENWRDNQDVLGATRATDCSSWSRRASSSRARPWRGESGWPAVGEGRCEAKRRFVVSTDFVAYPVMLQPCSAC